MDWKRLRPSPDATHHLVEGQPVYAARFDEVLAYHEPGLAPVRLGHEAWHMDVHARPAYARRFHRTFGFYEGRAAVISEHGWHHILPDGSDLYPERYAWCGNYQGGRCAVRDEAGHYRHLDLKGQPVCAERWRYAGDYRDGLAVVQAASGLSTHVEAHGRQLHGRWFLDLDVFHKGFARARDEEGWMHVDRTGQPVYARRFALVEPFYNGQARVERFDGGLEVIDETGTRVVELRPARRSELAALSEDLVGAWKTDTLAAAVRLGLFETLPGTEDAIASHCGLPPERCVRLLRALGELGLVRREAAGHWGLTARGEYLRPPHPLTLADAALEYAGPLRARWAALPEALRSEVWHPEDLFQQVATDPARRVTHHRMLRSYALHDYAPLLEQLPISEGERVVDAGGGTGALAGLLARRHPSVDVVVLDLPGVVAELEASEGDSRVRGVAADLFAPWPLAADVVVLARVLHDWDDADATRLLRNARAALRPGGRVLILEHVLQAQGYGGGLCDLHLLVVSGGQERTRMQFERLLTQAGLRLERVEPTPALPHVLVAVPA